MDRTFSVVDNNGIELKLAIKILTNDDLDSSEQVYGSKIAELIKISGKRKLLLRQEVDTFLKSQNIWGEKEQGEIESLQKEIDKLLRKLNKGGTKLSEGRSLAIKIIDKRSEVFQLLQKRQIFDNATIESYAETEKNAYLVYLATVHSDSGEKYWKSFEDCKNDKGTEVYNVANTTALRLLFGLETDIVHQLPETVWLKRYSYIDDNLSYIDRNTKSFVDKDGKPFKKTEQEPIEEFVPFTDDSTGEPVILETFNKE